MVLLLTGQGSEEEVVVPMVIIALLAAFVRAPAAGRAVAGGAARLVGTPAGHGVSGCGAASSQSRAHHSHAPVSRRGGGLGLDVEMLMTGGEV